MPELVHVIDDDPAVRDSLTFLLETANLQACAYDSAVAFLEALPQVTGGCVVTDVRMPEMTGIELVRRLKGQGSPCRSSCSPATPTCRWRWRR